MYEKRFKLIRNQNDTMRHQFTQIRWKNERTTILFAKGDVGTSVYFWLEICINVILGESNMATSVTIKNTYVLYPEIPHPRIYS